MDRTVSYLDCPLCKLSCSLPFEFGAETAIHDFGAKRHLRTPFRRVTNSSQPTKCVTQGVMKVRAQPHVIIMQHSSSGIVDPKTRQSEVLGIPSRQRGTVDHDHARGAWDSAGGVGLRTLLVISCHVACKIGLWPRFPGCYICGYIHLSPRDCWSCVSIVSVQYTGASDGLTR